MKVKISDKAYKTKPSAEEIGLITYGMKNKDCIEVSYKALGEIIERGYSFILADYKNNCKSVKEEYINYLECLALDIDSKENPITLYEMITLVHKNIGAYPILHYCTFSDTELTKFRLIYRLENKIDVETYKNLYSALIWKFKKYLDHATKNANRIWAGTNKKVTYNENDITISFQSIVKIINAHQSKLRREEKKREQQYTHKNIINSEVAAELANYDYIKSDYKKEVMDYLMDNIDLKDFIQKYFGGNFKYKSSIGFVGCCPLHGGDNKNAFVITNKTYRCYTHCGSGNLFTVARKAYNEENFSKVAIRLAREYNLNIPSEYIKFNN